MYLTVLDKFKSSLALTFLIRKLAESKYRKQMKYRVLNLRDE